MTEKQGKKMTNVKISIQLWKAFKAKSIQNDQSISERLEMLIGKDVEEK